MKIAGIRATPVNIPFTAPYVFSHGSMKSLTKTIVELDTDEGETGLGEVADGDRADDVVKKGETLECVDIREIGTAERGCLPGYPYTPRGNVAGIAFGMLGSAPLHQVPDGERLDPLCRCNGLAGFNLPSAVKPIVRLDSEPGTDINGKCFFKLQPGSRFERRLTGDDLADQFRGTTT